MQHMMCLNEGALHTHAQIYEVLLSVWVRSEKTKLPQTLTN